MRFSRWMSRGAMAAVLTSTALAQAATITINPPTVNRWMYPFGPANGTRTSASTFGAGGDPSFDERDAQYLLGFDTAAAGIPTGLGASSYQINSITLKLTVQDPSGGGGATFVYDPTYDSYTTYDSAPDTDAGRPIEIYGIGFRNGYTQLGLSMTSSAPPTWTVGTAFSSPGAPAPGVRHAYALGSNGSSLVDVSNNVGANGFTSGFEVTPLGIALAGLAPGAGVVHGTQMTASLAVTNPLYLAYLQSALDTGILGLAVTSMHEAGFGGPTTFPVFNTIHTPSEPASAKPILEIDYTIVPEPATWTLMGAGLAALLPLIAARSRRRRPARA